MCLRFVFLLIMRVAAWLRLSRREEVWKTAEILLLRHQLAVLQRRHPRRPKLNWADRALLAALLGLIPKARRQGLRLLVTRTRFGPPQRWLLTGVSSLSHPCRQSLLPLRVQELLQQPYPTGCWRASTRRRCGLLQAMPGRQRQNRASESEGL
jgi:hypothetical protein